jgi:hypothetical protein
VIDVLENQERDLVLVNRRRKKARKEAQPEPVTDTAAAELEALRARVAKAKATERPHDAQPHCGDCFRRGWKAAVSAIEAE